MAVKLAGSIGQEPVFTTQFGPMVVGGTGFVTYTTLDLHSDFGKTRSLPQHLTQISILGGQAVWATDTRFSEHAHVVLQVSESDPTYKVLDTIPLTYSDSPFDTVTFTRVNELASILQRLRQEGECAHAAAIAERLDDLNELCIEDYPQDPLLSVESVGKFVSFAGSLTKLRMPDLVVSPYGNVVAEWRESADKHLSLEFLPSGEIAYVLFARDPFLQGLVSRNSGSASIDTLLRVLAPYEAHHWMREETIHR